jgi:hypothetical protein
MKPYEQASNSMGAGDGLAHVRMSPDQLRTARATLRQAELIADTLIRANQDLHQLFALIGRGIGALARHSKVSASKPEWRLP